MTMTKTLEAYRDTLERIGTGTVSVDFAREILDVAESELEEAHGEYTLAQAIQMSGRSRSYFDRRLERWAADGLARKPGREWLIRRAVIPAPPAVTEEGFDPSTPEDEILRRLDEDDQRTVRE